MLYTLLNEHYTPEESLHKVFYIQTKAILKLFNLKVGTERASSQNIVHRMIRRYNHLKSVNPPYIMLKFWFQISCWLHVGQQLGKYGQLRSNQRWLWPAHLDQSRYCQKNLDSWRTLERKHFKCYSNRACLCRSLS